MNQMLKGQTQQEINCILYQCNQHQQKIGFQLDGQHGGQLKNEKLFDLLNKYVDFENANKHEEEETGSSQELKLKKPSKKKTSFSFFQSYKQRLINIMMKARHHRKLSQAQFDSLQKFFHLDDHNKKMICYSDHIILQTLRYAIYNRQQVPFSLVKVVNQMAKANMVRKWEIGYFITHQIIISCALSLQFQPPLDLYIEFLETDLIQGSIPELTEVFLRNQFFFKRIEGENQFYGTIGEKKRLILNQIPYMIKLFQKIHYERPVQFSFKRLQSYIGEVTKYFQYQSEIHLLQRYLPEVKINYLKLNPNLSSFQIQFLFMTLNTLNNLVSEDFKILYSTRSTKTPIIKEHQVGSWTKFHMFEELCTNVLTDKQFSLTVKQLSQIEKLLCQYQSEPNNIIQLNFIFMMLKEESYKSHLFQKNLLRNVIEIFKNIPDKKRIKESAYILLFQYFKLIDQNSNKRQQIMRQYYFPLSQLQKTLDEGRQLVLDLLLKRKEQLLIIDDETKYNRYMKIVKKLHKSSNNKKIRERTHQIYEKIKKFNNFKNKKAQLQENKILNSEYAMQYIQREFFGEKKIHIECINNLLIILNQADNCTIIKACLQPFFHLIKNSKNGQSFPQNFPQKLIYILRYLYKEKKLQQDTKNQIVKLSVQCISLVQNKQNMKIIAQFLLQVYFKSTYVFPQNIYSSYGIFLIAKNSYQHNQETKKFFQNLAYQTLKTYRNTFQPKSKACANILCTIVVLAKKRVILPADLPEQLARIGVFYQKFAVLALTAIYYYAKNRRNKPISQKTMQELCKILKQTQKYEVIISILQLYMQRERILPISVKREIKNIITIRQGFGFQCSDLKQFLSSLTEINMPNPMYLFHEKPIKS